MNGPVPSESDLAAAGEHSLSVAVAAARRGGEILMEHRRRGVRMRNKSSRGGMTYDLVSDADEESEQVIASQIRSVFPDHELIGEEHLRGDAGARDVWIIDPLDGTNNYAHGVDHFAVSIAHYHGGHPASAVIHNPATGAMHTAVAGGPSRTDGDEVSVGDQTDLSGVLVGCGFYYDRGPMMRQTLAAIEELFGRDIHGIRRFGTASLDLVMVGRGWLGGFFEYQLSPWDFAAGRLFVERAGGRITNGRGRPLGTEKTSVLASNGALHRSLLDIVARHHPGKDGDDGP